MKRIADCFRNPGARALFALALLGITTGAQAQIQVTEVMYNATDDNAWEWIEIRNTGGSAIDLNGYLGFNLGDANIPAPNPTISNALLPVLDNADTTVQPGEVAIIYDGFFGSGNPQNYVDNSFRTAWGLNPSTKLIAADFFPGMTNTEGNQGQSIGFWPNATAWQMDQTPVEDDPINFPGVFTNRTSSFTNAAFSLNFSDAAFPAPLGNASLTWNGNGSNQAGANWGNSQTGVNSATTSSLFTYTGAANNPADVGNPGIIHGTPSTAGLLFSEVLYDSAGSEPNWEWIEVYNNSATAVNLAGYVVDDNSTTAVSAANIAAGTIPAFATGILYNSELVTGADFAAAWGATLNLIPVTEWSDLQLNNTGDQISLWTSFAAYTGNHATHAGALTTQAFLESNGFPTGANGPSIFMPDMSADRTVGGNWVNAASMDVFGSFNATALFGTITHHPGGDVASPGSFTVVAADDADFDDDGDVDGRDFLIWQRGFGTGATNATGDANNSGTVDGADLAIWQTQYGIGPLVAAVGVPEPTSLGLLGIMLGTLACTRRR